MLMIFRSQEMLKIFVNNYTVSRNHYSSKKSNENSWKYWKSNYLSYTLASALAASTFALIYLIKTDKKRIKPLENYSITPGVWKDNLKSYTIEEIGKHDNENTGVWVYYKEGVYDITEFIKQHPGGKNKIIMAAGGSIESFWQIFANHNTNEIYKLLETMRIGNLKLTETQKVDNNYDPYGNEPKRHKAFIINGPKPFCAEPPASMLVKNFITPL